MKKYFSILAGLALVVFLSTPSLTAYSQKASNAPVSPAAGPQDIKSLAQSTAPAIANFILRSLPVVAEERATQGESERRQKLALESMHAQTYEAKVKAEQKDFESQVFHTFPDARIVTELTKLLNVVAIEAPGWELARIAAMPGVSEARIAQTSHAVLDKSVPLINAPAVWNKVGGSQMAGQGVKIAILDTGIDLSNPLFSDAGFSYPAGFPRGNPSFVNKKVIAAKVFLSDPSATPSDQDGHGTNVAGIAAGDFNTPTPLGVISGVAPAAYLGNYRVLDATGTGADVLIAAGLEAALSDGFDVASMSLGQTASSTLNIQDVAVENAVAAGMVVVVAAGNNGPGGGTITSPGIAPHAITVAASSNGHLIGSAVTVTGPGNVPANLQGIESFAGAFSSGCAPDPAIGPLNYKSEASLPNKNKRGCKGAKIPANALAGDVALIERGTCSFAQKINNAEAAGALSAIIYNQDISENPANGGDNLILMDVTGSSIPSVFVKRSDGLALVSWVTQNPSAQIEIGAASEFTEVSDVVAAFSSRGPTAAGVLKPDLSAPGVNIYSGALKSCAEVSDPSGFAPVSGTSQATPHVAGSAALVKQMHPSWSPEQIKSALISSATTAVFDDTAKTTQSDVLEVGGGRVDLAGASSVTVTTDPANLSFGIVKLKKTVTLSQTFTVRNVASGATNLAVSITQLNADSHVSVSPSTTTLSLAQGDSSSITITITAVKGAAKRDYTGYVALTPASGPAQRVPYWVEL